MCHFQKCPRCGEKSFEKLPTHAYCVNCNYSKDLDHNFNDDDMPIPNWAQEAVNEIEKREAELKPAKKKSAKNSASDKEAA